MGFWLLVTMISSIFFVPSLYVMKKNKDSVVWLILGGRVFVAALAAFLI